MSSTPTKPPRTDTGQFAPVPADQEKESIVVLRVRRAEKASWTHASQAAGTTLSEWIRKTLAKHILPRKK